MVYRIFVEKKDGLAHEADALLNELTNLVGIKNLKSVRILNRYDAERIEESVFNQSISTVFSEPQLDIATENPEYNGDKVFAVEYLPGQFDQRADSAAQCIQIASLGERPIIRSAKVYVLGGDLTDKDVEEIKKYVINPVESREASLEEYKTQKRGGRGVTGHKPKEEDFVDNMFVTSTHDDILFFTDKGKVYINAR